MKLLSQSNNHARDEKIVTGEAQDVGGLLQIVGLDRGTFDCTGIAFGLDLARGLLGRIVVVMLVRHFKTVTSQNDYA